MKDFDVLNKALDNVKKSQPNFVNGDGRDNRDTIHSNPVNNENGSISRTTSATGDGNDPVNSSNLDHKNPIGQSGNGVHAEGTKTTKTGNATSDKDPVSTSTDDLDQYSKESKSQTHHDYDRTGKDKNGVREVHNPVHNSTRNLGDKPNANASAENHITQAASGTKHNNAEISASIKKLINLDKSLINAIKVNAGNINALHSSYTNDMKNISNKIAKTNKAINAPKTVNNTTDKSNEAKAMAGIDPKTDKHMNPANIRGMFYHAEHDKGKKHTKEMADAENAVTRCHHSHKNIDPDKLGDIEAKAYIGAAKSIMNQMGDTEAAKSLDSKLIHDAKSGNTSALAHDNYKYDQSEKAQHTHKSVENKDTSKSEAANLNKGMNIKSCKSMLASASKAGDSATYHRCASMCNAMASGKAAKSEAADLAKNIDSVDHNSKANTGNIRAESKQKPNSKSDDIDNSTKSESANTTKSMPHGKAINADKDVKTEKSLNKDIDHSKSVNKSMNKALTPSQIKHRANLFIDYFKDNTNLVNKSMAHKAINTAKTADNVDKLNKSIRIFEGKE